MYQFTDVPLPPDSHYIGIIFTYEEDGKLNFLSVKDRDKNENRLNIKLPGGTNERIYDENYMLYENALFKDLENMGFTRPALIKIYKNERAKRKVMEEQYGSKEPLGWLLRTMCLECLRKVGYYPMDTEPSVTFVMEKAGHTQYFVVVKTLIDKEGNEVTIPKQDDGFRPKDLGVKETRVPIAINDYRTLIFSHKTAVEKYMIANGLSIPSEEEDDEEED